MKNITLSVLFLLTCSMNVNSQVSSRLQNRLHKTQREFAEKLKTGKIDDCISYFHNAEIERYGLDSLKKELLLIHDILNKNYKVSYSTMTSPIGKKITMIRDSCNCKREVQYNIKFVGKEKNILIDCQFFFDNRRPKKKIKFFVPLTESRWHEDKSFSQKVISQKK